MQPQTRRIFIALGVVILIIFFGSSLVRTAATYHDKLEFYQDLQDERDKEKSRNKQLKSDVRKSKDYYYIERNIRERLNLLQNGEISVILPPLSPSPSPTPLMPKTPLEQWKDLLIQ